MRESPPQAQISRPRSRGFSLFGVLNRISPSIAGSMERSSSKTWNELSSDTLASAVREAGGIDTLDLHTFIHKEIPTLASVFAVSETDARRIRELFKNLGSLDLFQDDPGVHCIGNLTPKDLLRAERTFPGIKVEIEIVRELARRMLEESRENDARLHSWKELEVHFFRARILKAGLDNLNFETIARAPVQLIAEALYVPHRVAVTVRKAFIQLQESFLSRSASRKVWYLVDATPHELDALDFAMSNNGQGSIIFALEMIRTLIARAKRHGSHEEESHPLNMHEFQTGVLRDLLRRYPPFLVPLVYITGAPGPALMEAMQVDAATGRTFSTLAWIFRENNQMDFDLSKVPISVYKRIEHDARTRKLDLKGTLANFRKKTEEVPGTLRLIQGDRGAAVREVRR